MQNMDEIMELLDDRGFDVKDFMMKLLSKWYWFVILGFIGVFSAYFYNKSLPATYKMYASVLIDDENDGMRLDQVFDGLGMDVSGSANVENHILMLKSYTLNQEAVRNLHLDVSWFKKGIFIDGELYGQYPYILFVNKSSKNLEGINIEITPLSFSSYTVKVKGKYYENGSEFEIDMLQKGIFGMPFQSDVFNFTLLKNREFILDEESEYYFRINNLRDLTKSYISLLDVSLANENANGIILSLQETSPDRGVDYLNALTSAYLKYGLNQKNRTSQNTVHFIDQQINSVVDSLRIAGHSFTEFRSRKGIVDLSAEAEQVVERLRDLQVEKELAERKVEYFKNLQNYMNDADQMQNIAVPSVLGIDDSGLNALVVQLGDLYSRRSSMSFVVKDRNPAYQMVNNKIENCLNSLSENIKNLLRNTTIELDNINSQLKDVERRLAGLPKTEQQLINIKRSFDLNNELYTFLLQRRAEAAIATASNVPDATVLDASTLDTVERTGPQTMKILLMGLILGLAVPFLSIVLFDYFDDTIKSKEELEKLCKLPFVTAIVRNKYNVNLPVYTYPKSSISETFRTLRHSIQYLSNSKQSKVIAVHSLIPGEGKTFTSLNLASILALDNKKVLFVGCDLRKPQLHKIFNCRNDKGLSSFLIDKHFYREIITETEQENLFYTLSGPIPPNPSELIGNGKFKGFIDEAKKDFDFIVLDNAPISLVIDGYQIGEHADTNLIVIRQGYSHKKQIAHINKLKDKDKFKNPAVILNDAINIKNPYMNKTYNGYYDDGVRKTSVLRNII